MHAVWDFSEFICKNINIGSIINHIDIKNYANENNSTSNVNVYVNACNTSRVSIVAEHSLMDRIAAHARGLPARLRCAY